MVLSWRTSWATGMSLLLCLLLTGRGHSRGSSDEVPEMTNPANNSFIDSTEPVKSEQKRENTAATFLPTETSFLLDSARAPGAQAERPQAVWGIVDVRGFPIGQEVASNGVEYNPLFLLDLSYNVMVWPQQHLYLYADTAFWGQKPGPGITNPSQGSFDFSKREFDFNVGTAWNYAGQWEARFFAYSFNNLNRGNSQTSPSGFNDGVGLENRYYLGETYSHLGTEAFDQARATFLSVGYYPSKSMVDANGCQFKPGPFARAYLTCDLWSEEFYLYADVQFIAARSFQPTLLNLDAGLAARPFTSVPRLEFRVGTQDMLNLQGGDFERSVYLAIRYVF